jgi:hypothetical protein
MPYLPDADETNEHLIIERLTKERDEAQWDAEMAKQERDEARAAAEVRGGEWCAKNRAEGRGPCGACVWCCEDQKERAEKAEAEVARLRARLQFDPGGSDKIDELEQAMEFLRFNMKTAETEVARLNALMTDVACSAHGDGQASAAADVARLEAEVARLRAALETAVRAIHPCVCHRHWTLDHSTEQLEETLKCITFGTLSLCKGCICAAEQIRVVLTARAALAPAKEP